MGTASMGKLPRGLQSQWAAGFVKRKERKGVDDVRTFVFLY